MSLIRGCAFPNPLGAARPPIPAAAAAGAQAPAQGDHLFGDVLGTIEDALKRIFSGNAVWRTRMGLFNSNLLTLWNGLEGMDLGHGAHPPVSQRSGPPEPDEHAHVFGGYSQRLAWELCEVTCTNGQQRRVGGATRAWKTAVMARFDEVMAHLVDETALHHYIATPNHPRPAAPAVVRHHPISLAAARTYANGANGPGKNEVIRILSGYAGLRGSLEGLLLRFDESVKTWSEQPPRWI